MPTKASLGLTIQIGSQEITIESDNLPSSIAQVKSTTYSLPAGTTIEFTIKDIIDWFNTTFGLTGGSAIPDSLPYVTDTKVEINTFAINFDQGLLKLGFKVTIGDGGLFIPGTQIGFKAVSIVLTRTGAVVGVPTITGPATGAAGSPVNFVGTNMTHTTGATIGGVAMTGITGVTATTVTATIPAGTVATGSTPVIITNAAGASAPFNIAVTA